MRKCKTLIVKVLKAQIHHLIIYTLHVNFALYLKASKKLKILQISAATNVLRT
jgi:hypothetical protein